VEVKARQEMTLSCQPGNVTDHRSAAKLSIRQNTLQHPRQYASTPSNARAALKQQMGSQIRQKWSAVKLNGSELVWYTKYCSHKSGQACNGTGVKGPFVVLAS
jgi:hypothetical protein